MVYNFKLFWRTMYRSFFAPKNTPARLTRKRITFLLLFYLVWPMGSLMHWFCFFLDDILFPGHKTQPIEKPLFILGNLRSGSTFLHRLLSRDSETFTSLTIWDIYLTPSVTQKKITQLVSRMDKKLGGHLHRLLYEFDRRTLGKFKVHRISFFQPEEDENILLHIWDSFWVSFLFPFVDEMPNYRHFDEALTPEHKRRIMAFYKSMLQRHLYATAKNISSPRTLLSAPRSNRLWNSSRRRASSIWRAIRWICFPPLSHGSTTRAESSLTHRRSGFIWMRLWISHSTGTAIH